MPPVPVTAAKVVKQEAFSYLDAIGSLSALEAVDIIPQVSGRILEIHFTQGADVKKGDLLFSIDPAPYIAALHDAEAKLAANQAELALNQAQLKRSLTLVAGNYVSAQDIDTLKAKVQVSEAAIQGAQAAIETAKINLDYCTIRAPIDGVAGKYQIDEGNVVSSYSKNALVSLQHVDTLYVDFSAPEAELHRIQEALQRTGALRLEVSALTDAAVKADAVLKYVDNRIQSSSGMVPLRAELPNPRRLFWPGQSIAARIILASLPDALVVPYQALQFGQQGAFVFAVKGGKTADIRRVQPGQRQGDMIVINQGLGADDTVILTGQLMLSPGAPVMVLPERKDGPPAAGQTPDRPQTGGS